MSFKGYINASKAFRSQQKRTIMEKMKMETKNWTSENIEKIGELFPNVITEARGEDGQLKKAINFEALRQVLSEDLLEGDEAFEFTWVGKKAAMVEAGKPIRKTLRPSREESKNWDTTENLYIEGDNLDVLKLLQESYLGKVKMIYIDPPYNTGNDFIYNDHFEMDKEDYEEQTGLFDNDLNKNFKENNESNPRFHSDWCSMMYPRLQLARNLLANDGVIFISIDDNEQANIKKICDEIFGSEKFLAQFKWNRTAKAPSLSNHVRTKYEYVISYLKGDKVNLFGKMSYNTQAPLLNITNKQNEVRFPQNSIKLRNSFAKGVYSDKYQVELLDDVKCFRSHNANAFRIKGCFKWSQKKIDDYLGSGKVFEVKRDFSTIYYSLDTDNSFIAPSDLISDEECGVKRNTEADAELKKLRIPFDYSKPVSLIHYLAKASTYNSFDSLVMDFFSGSATTAHAVMQLNAEDGGKRKFIMVQLPELTDEKSEAYKAGYKNICEIGKERIRRAGEKIKSEIEAKALQPGLTDEPKQVPDIGFRVLKLADSNMKDVYYNPQAYNQEMISDMESNIKEDRNDLDLLFGCLLEWGLPLSMPYTSEQIEGITVHTYNQGDLVACFDENIPETVVKQIASRQPLRAVFRDGSFSSSPEKINVAEIFKLLSPNTTVKVL